MQPRTSEFGPPATLDDALAQIRAFWSGSEPFVGGFPEAASRLQAQFGRRFPGPLAQYVSRLLPANGVVLERVGNPVSFWALGELTPDPKGYRIDGRGRAIPGWSQAWFIFADVGADPVIIDLDEATDMVCPVLQAMHGAGEWNFGLVADSLPQYLLLSAAIHHALKMVPNAILDGDRGFELAEPAASWLFPRMRGWAGPHYETWTGNFGNS